MYSDSSVGKARLYDLVLFYFICDDSESFLFCAIFTMACEVRSVCCCLVSPFSVVALAMAC